jgi:hypothetical protein
MIIIYDMYVSVVNCMVTLCSWHLLLPDGKVGAAGGERQAGTDGSSVQMHIVHPHIETGPNHMFLCYKS